MKDYLPEFLYSRFGVFATIIVIFTYNFLLDRDFICTCKPQTEDCHLHMILPFFIIFILILWTDKKFQRTWKYVCTCPCPRSNSSCVEERGKKHHFFPFVLVLIHRMMKAVLVGLLWVASVLINGHWYVCCQNDQSDQQIHSACKKNISADEQRIIAELENSSKLRGFFMLFGIIVAAALMPLFGWRKCCEGQSTCCDREVLYATLILEEEKNVLKEVLREEVKTTMSGKMKEKMTSRKWKECFDVAEKLIEERSGEQSRQLSESHTQMINMPSGDPIPEEKQNFLPAQQQSGSTD